MGQNQSGHRGQVDTMTGAIVTRSRRFEAMRSEDRQFVIANPDIALDLFVRTIKDRDVLLVSSKQVAALKYLIRVAKDGSDLLKRLMFILLDSSELLTKQVYITLESSEELDDEAIQQTALSCKGMHSCNGTTYMDQVMHAMGTEFSFSYHYGNYDQDQIFNTVGMFPGYKGDPGGMPIRYTFWLARGNYGHTAGELTRIEVSKADIEAVNLSRDGLYDLN